MTTDLVQTIKPRYEVHPYNGTTSRTTCTFDKKKRQLVTKTVDDEGGFMIYFPKGHSIRARDAAHLVELGFDQPATLIDMETGDEAGREDSSLRAHSDRITRLTKSGENLPEGKEANS